MKNISGLLLILVLVTSCYAPKTDNTQQYQNSSQEELVMATLYQYFAEEYKALAYQAYNTAHQRIENLVKQKADPTKMAIVLDIDETVLDNSPYQAKIILENTSYPDYWLEWCELASARAIPGAVEFLNYADSLGFQIFYISNRKKKSEEASTIKNLISEGFPQVVSGHILLKEEKSESNPDPSNKDSRRLSVINQGIQIVMLIGDNLGDFYNDGVDSDSELKNLAKNKSQFGAKYIVLPNAMYGNWPARIGKKNRASADSLLNIMTACFNKSE
jgi:5'-nucleotidase (lipoprotein e(P4) family)